KIVEGRQFHSGQHELTIGVAAARVFHLPVGDRIPLPAGPSSIVASFAGRGSTLEGLFLADADTVLAAGRTSGYGSVLVKLESADAFNTFSHWVTTNPALKESAEPLTGYLQRTTHQFSAFFS